LACPLGSLDSLWAATGVVEQRRIRAKTTRDSRAQGAKVFLIYPFDRVSWETSSSIPDHRL
jgi:hypothetical protein